jgi:ACS family hexuronate transporter-like MFS transporter
MTNDQTPRTNTWTWTLCLILLGATLLNYANRMALTQNAGRAIEAFQTDEAGYGKVNGWFSLGFACGGLLFGMLADVISVRILYPGVVLIWSAASVCCGLVRSLEMLIACQFLLALFEAGHWPCALRTTQRTFKPAMRTWGNSLLQSGASLGAILTPQIVAGLYRYDPAQWRWVFFIVGGLSVPWVIAWLATVREADVRRPVIQTDETAAGEGEARVLQEVPFWTVFTMRRWWLLLAVVSLINVVWHYIRVWLPLWLGKERGYPDEFVQHFTSAYYGATFVGSLAAGWLTAALPRWGWNVHHARLAVFLLCGLLTAMVIPAAFLPKGNMLLVCLLLTGFGSLGLFPIYYSLNQEISARNQGKVGGSLAFSTWGMLYFFHEWVGNVMKTRPELKPLIVSLVGLGPLVAFLVLLLFWGRREEGVPASE